MTNEMKLLRAFIEASGFDIKQTDNAAYGEVVPLGKMAISCGNKQWKYFPDESVYKEVLYPVDYKVTKKPDPLDVMYNGVSLSQLVENVYQEIEWIKYPKESFYAVIEWFGDEAERVNEHRYNINGVEVSLNEED